MRQLIILIALAGCTDGASSSGTLETGDLTSAHWGGGLCQAGFSCSGSLLFGNGSVLARGPDGQTVAHGALTSAALDDIADRVAAIPLSEPTGILAFEDAISDSGTVELEIHRTGEIRLYLSEGFRGDLGVYVAGLRDQVKTCTTDTRIASYDSCTLE